MVADQGCAMSLHLEEYFFILFMGFGIYLLGQFDDGFEVDVGLFLLHN
jgi:hypothetical protein